MNIDSWHALPLIKNYINLYTGMKFIVQLAGNSLQISYDNTWYVLHDNGGEVTVSKINDSNHFAEFPTMWFSESLNTETLMYRLVQSLKGEAIDYKFREKEFHFLFDTKQIFLKNGVKVMVNEQEMDNVNWWAA